MQPPFEMVSVGSDLHYCKVNIPDCCKIYSIFSFELLKKYTVTDPIQQVIEIEGNSKHWVMEMIIASGSSNEDMRKHVCLVQ